MATPGFDQTLSRQAMRAELLDAETELKLAYAGAINAMKRRCIG